MNLKFKKVKHTSIVYYFTFANKNTFQFYDFGVLNRETHLNEVSFVLFHVWNENTFDIYEFQVFKSKTLLNWVNFIHFHDWKRKSFGVDGFLFNELMTFKIQNARQLKLNFVNFNICKQKYIRIIWISSFQK